MSAFVPFDCFALDLGLKKHNLSTDVLKIYLTDVAPDPATDTVYGTPADLATSGGYTSGGSSLGANTWTQFAGLAALVAGANVVFTATSGFGPFRYVILYNFTAAAKNLIGYWDNGSEVTLAAAQTFEVDFSPQVLTLEF